MKTEKKTIPVQEEVYPDEVKEMALCPPAPETETEDPEAPYMASDMYQRIVALINNFESELPDTMQAGGRLVSAGDITFSIQDIGYWDPNMIELVQHLSQLNLLLVAVPRQDDIQKPRRVIGFTQKAEPDIIHDAQD